MYNFEVKGFHTYFVGDSGLLVHNKCGDYKKINEVEFEKQHNLPEGTFHRKIKPEILKECKPDWKVGKNPDIMLNRIGNIAYQSAGRGKIKGLMETGLNIRRFLDELF